MEIEQLIAKIESEKDKAKDEQSSEAGLVRLQQVASEYQGEYRLVWSDDVQKEIELRPKRENLYCGVEDIDFLTGGFREQQMIGIGAHSGHGKTAMGLFFLKQYERLNPVLLPLEQSCEELIEQRMENGQFVPKYLSPKKHQSRVTVDWIEERIIEGIAKYNSRMIMIDHMGYIDAGNQYRGAGEHIQIEKKLQDIKHLAIKWNVTIVILIQLVQSDEAIPPSLKDLKGSSAIRQECDKIIFLWRKNALKGKVRIYKNETLFSLQKNRFNGVNGNIGLGFKLKTGEYEVTEESRKWVKDMTDSANEQMDNDDNEFDY